MSSKTTSKPEEMNDTGTALGRPCQLTNSRLDPLTHVWKSDCDSTTFCSLAAGYPQSEPVSAATLKGTGKADGGGKGTQKVLAFATGAAAKDSSAPSPALAGKGTCVARGCRRDEYPWGYPEDAPLPPLCDPNEYCPDDGSSCSPLVPVGGICELNRDDECAPPPPEQQALYADPAENFFGALCLAQKCTWTSATEGSACQVDGTVYTGWAADGQMFTDIVQRDNCAPGFYCSSGTSTNGATTCASRKSLLSPCLSDRECLSSNCSPLNSLCATPPSYVRAPPGWAYALVALALLLGMFVLVCGLVRSNARRRREIRRERRDAWAEQRGFRETIERMHQAGRSTVAGTSKVDSDLVGGIREVGENEQ